MNGARVMREIVGELRRRGHAVVVSGSGHWRVLAPRGVVFMASSPSDWRAVENAKRDLKRYGVDVRGL